MLYINIHIKSCGTSADNTNFIVRLSKKHLTQFIKLSCSISLMIRDFICGTTILETFSVAKVTLESHMSVRLFISPSPKPLSES